MPLVFYLACPRTAASLMLTNLQHARALADPEGASMQGTSSYGEIVQESNVNVLTW